VGTLYPLGPRPHRAFARAVVVVVVAVARTVREITARVAVVVVVAVARIELVVDIELVVVVVVVCGPTRRLGGGRAGPRG